MPKVAVGENALLVYLTSGNTRPYPNCMGQHPAPAHDCRPSHQTTRPTWSVCERRIDRAVTQNAFRASAICPPVEVSEGTGAAFSRYRDLPGRKVRVVVTEPAHQGNARRVLYSTRPLYPRRTQQVARDPAKQQTNHGSVSATRTPRDVLRLDPRASPSVPR